MIREKGLSAIELLIALAIGAILATTALPALSHLIDRNRVEVGVQAMIRSLALARSEAVKRSDRVSVFNEGNHWEDGWVVFNDENRNGIYEVSEALIYKQAPLSGVRIYGNTYIQSAVNYRADGHNELLNGGLQMGTFYFCPSNNQQISAYKIALWHSGRPRVEKLITNDANCRE